MTAPVGTISYPGQYIINDCTITSSNGNQINATPLVVGIQIFEDMFSPFVSGYLTIRDALGINELLPLNGEETVSLNIQTPGLTNKYQQINEVFYLYSMKTRTNVSNRTQEYVLGFCTRETMINAGLKFSRAMQGSIDKLVETVVTDKSYLGSVKPYTIEQTGNSIQYISNYWDVFKNLKYLADHAINVNNNPNYVFFENRYGVNFVSIDSLVKASPLYQSFYYDNYTPAIDKNYDLNAMYGRVEELEITSEYNFLRSMQSGLLASVALSYDSIRKTYNALTFDYLNDFNNENHLNANPLYTQQSVRPMYSHLYNVPRAFNNFDSVGDESVFSTIQRRNSLLEQYNENKIKIVVPGRFDYTVGEVVQFTTYTSAGFNKGTPNVEDTSLTANYLVTALQHLITMEKHYCIMELSTDSSTASTKS